ncbi:MAG TPA: TMEM175 family protein [Propionibacteriaceae bacterium]
MADENDDLVVRVSRMEAFSDGVFAIAITLLVLELSLPEGSEGHLLRAVLDLWPSYLAYIVSFATIGATWLGHNSITHYMHGANATLLRLNLALLLVVSFLPFPTKLVAEYLGSREDEKVAATIFGVTLLAVTSLLSLMWVQAVRHHLVHPATGDEEITLLSKRLRPSLALYLVLIVVGWFTPLIAVIGYLVIAFFLIFPIKLGRRKRSPAVS